MTEDGDAPEEPADAADGETATDAGTPTADDRAVKMVTAVVRPDRVGDVKRALAEVGAPSLTVTQVSGRGSQSPRTERYRGEEYVVDLREKAKVECVVADVPAEAVVEAIREAAHTGDPGDGKIFVLPVETAVDVRTGDRGPDAV